MYRASGFQEQVRGWRRVKEDRECCQVEREGRLPCGVVHNIERAESRARMMGDGKTMMEAASCVYDRRQHHAPRPVLPFSLRSKDHPP